MLPGYIDRIEEGLAVIQFNDGDYQINFPAELLPEDLGEGDYITLEFKKDEEKNAQALAEILALMED